MIGALVAAVRPVFAPLLKLDLAPPHLPEGPAVRTLRPAAAYLAYRYLAVAAVGLIESLPVVILGGLAVARLGAVGLLIAVPLLALYLFVMGVVLVATRLDWELRHYVLGRRSLRVRAGAWVQREITLSYANVQNVEVVQGPLERAFGFKSLRVSTAGGQSAKDKLHGGGSHDALLVGLEDADEVRELILGVLRGRRDAGLGDADDAAAPADAAPAPAGAAPARDRAAALGEVLAAARALRAAAEAHRRPATAG
ncbi:MAG TPA: PH domain-containing protein [Polyangia bacterium]